MKEERKSKERKPERKPEQKGNKTLKVSSEIPS